jgi:flagellar hook-basal body complex protein FliE
MTGTIAGLAQGIRQQGLQAAGEQPQSFQAGGRTFQRVLQNTEQRPAEGTTGPRPDDATPRVEAAPQESQRVEHLDPNVRQSLTRIVLNEESGARGRSFMDLLSHAEKMSSRSEVVLKELSTNRDLSQGDLLVMQAMVYKAAQSTETMSKVVDQVTGSFKTILNTNV